MLIFVHPLWKKFLYHLGTFSYVHLTTVSHIRRENSVTDTYLLKATPMYQTLMSGQILWAFTVLHWHQLLLHLTLHFNLNVHACKLHKMYYVGRIWCVCLGLSYCNCGLEFCAVKTALLKPEETFRIKQLICQGFTWLSNCCKSHCRRQRFILETHPNLKPELRFLLPLIVPNWRHTWSFVTEKQTGTRVPDTTAQVLPHPPSFQHKGDSS